MASIVVKYVSGNRILIPSDNQNAGHTGFIQLDNGAVGSTKVDSIRTSLVIYNKNRRYH